MRGYTAIFVAFCFVLTSIMGGCLGNDDGDSDGSSNQSLTCSLSASPPSGAVPLAVTFSLSASDTDGSISSWTLDIDNDGSADYSGYGNPDTSIEHTYNTVGVFKSNLTVTNENNYIEYDTIMITVTEIPNENPHCSSLANPLSGHPPLTVTFSLEASDSDGTITAWTLDVDNDGNAEYSGTGQPPATKQYTYTQAGTYWADLHVYDNRDGEGNSNRQIIVEELPAYFLLHPIADTYVYQYEPDTNYGGAHELEVGQNQHGDNDPTSVNIAYLLFDISDIPFGTSIKNAQLTLHTGGVGGTTALVGVHRCMNISWKELWMTYNNAPSFRTTPTDTEYIAFAGSHSWDVTQDVQDALSVGKISFALKIDNENDGGFWMYFYSNGSRIVGADFPVLYVEL
jgi:PKD repeat protein